MKIIHILPLLHLLLPTAATKYCRCEINDDARVTTVPQCTNCTTDFCYKDVFDRVKNETDKLSLVCFQKESTKEATVIYLFIAVVFGLVVYAGYLLKL